MPMHDILGGKVKVYRRPESAVWQCSTQLLGKRLRHSTKEKSLAAAKDVAEDWYLTIQGKLHSGQAETEKAFTDASVQFSKEYEIITEGDRGDAYTKSHKDRIRLHLLPFFGSLGLSQINPGKTHEYRIHLKSSRDVPPSRSQTYCGIYSLMAMMSRKISPKKILKFVL